MSMRATKRMATSAANRCKAIRATHTAAASAVPLRIINLSDGPWRLSGADDPVTFDIDADGMPNHITWIGRGEPLAFLALDRNRNGSIDDGGELFGTATLSTTGSPTANGFDALKELDGNGDRLIDQRDAIWTRLLLWTDANHDGISQTAELRPLAQSDVRALRTDYRESSRTDRASNSFRYMSTLQMTQGQRPYYDIFFVSAP